MSINTLWAPKITLKSGKSWLYAHAIGFTRTEAKLNYLHSDRDTTDKRYGSKVTFVRVEVTELTPNVELRGGPAALSPEAPLERRVGPFAKDG